MASLSDEAEVSQLFLPGSHETCAFWGWPISTCQSEANTIYNQLCSGIRFVDLRFSIKGDVLEAYHGIQPEYTTADAILGDLYRFLRAHPSETVIVSVKQVRLFTFVPPCGR